MSAPADLARVEALFRRGDLAAAGAEGERALAARPDDPALLELVGTISCHQGDLAGGAQRLRRALELAPDRVAARVALANALAMLGDEEGALALCESGPPGLLRLQGYILQTQGRFAEAAACYERIVAASPSDWEIWNNLGNARRAAGDLGGAIEALERARRIRPELAPVQLNLAMSLVAAGRLDEALEPYAEAARLDPGNADLVLEFGKLLRHLGRHAEALEPLRAAAALAPERGEVQLELGRAQAGLADLAGAEAAYRRALALEPGLVLAFLELGIVLERGNRLDRLAPLLREAEARGVKADDLLYLRALCLREEGRIAEALDAARRSPADVEPARRALLIGKLADRLGDAPAAFAAFREANEIAAAVQADPDGYLRRVEALTSLVSPFWYSSWSPAVPETRPAPVFLVGFPRSGTTLLDTMLMGHGRVAVLEEAPILERVSEALGEYERLPDLGPSDVDALRAVYFEALDSRLPDAGGRMVVDKLPLNLLAAPLIHRLFPDARFIFAQRHPCDVVLSCFMQDFAINDAMANFLDLGDTARLYDLALTFWDRCRDVLPLRVHVTRYESLVEDAESEARVLLDFLGLPWDPAMLDHRRTAAARGTISTPSYSQVIRPLYREASGRWERYREPMAPVLPILAPWAQRLGYGDVFEAP